jgi:hypothetical protein
MSKRPVSLAGVVFALAAGCTTATVKANRPPALDAPVSVLAKEGERTSPAAAAMKRPSPPRRCAHSGFQMQHCWALLADVYIDLYTGDGRGVGAHGARLARDARR